MARADVELRSVLERARAQRYLGPMPLDAQLAHAGGFVDIICREPVEHIVDLGSGGGLPGLAIAVELPHVELALVERGARRAAFLTQAAIIIGLDERVAVLEGEAERFGRDPRWAGWADVVTARSFGPPAITAECGCRFLRPGGRLIVSEPPPDVARPVDRWPREGLAPTGLVPTRHDELAVGTYQTLRLEGPIDDRIPRRVARPLY